MERPATIDLHIPSILGYEKVAMDCAASVAKTMGFPADRIEDLKTAISEACTNAIEHGNSMNADLRVGVHFAMEDSKLQVDVQDEGKGVGRVESPRIEDKIEGDDKSRGWGVFLIKGLMDEVTFESDSDGRHVVRMVIHLKK
jgi:serine/threonine-protein kinase RsbW